MKKVLIILMICLMALPINAFAYSYGDPTKEAIAETFKLIKGKINVSTPDWDGAYEAYKVRRAEIASHFGESIAVTLDQNFKNKNKELLIKNYRYVLYLNIDRRFSYAEKALEDYSKTKILLAKGKGTFDVLTPYVKLKLPGEVTKLNTAFDHALKALGNPGLFGVGKEPLKPEEFKKQKDYILSTLKPIFSYTPSNKEKESSTKTKEEVKETPAENTVKNEKDSTEKNQTSNEPEKNKVTESNPEEVEQKQEQVSNVTSETTTENEGNKDEAEAPSTERTTSPTDTTDNINKENAVQKEAKVSKEEIVKSASENKSDTTVTPKEETVEAASHAPMDQESKTNPVISVVVIASIIILGVGGIWFARKKEFI